jgi:hypothetical protein
MTAPETDDTTPETETTNVYDLLTETQIRLISDFQFSLSEATQEARDQVDYTEFNDLQAEASKIGKLTAISKAKMDAAQKAFNDAIANAEEDDAKLGKLVKTLTEAKTTWEAYANKSDELNGKVAALNTALETRVKNGIKAAVAKAIADYRASKGSAQAQFEAKVKLTFAEAPGNLKVDDKGTPNWGLAYAVGMPAIKEYERRLIALGNAARELDSAANAFGLNFNLRVEYPVFVTPDMIMRAAAGDRAVVTENLNRAFASVKDVPLIRNQGN